jgi:TetR/AcrR family transcriptional regulator, regulator of cefoperazone and chloramphenicol sensitivity
VTTTTHAATSRDRILRTATELFAEHGYDATSTRTIADAVDLNIATVAYHVGGKPDLYREVMRRGHEAQRAAMAGPLEELAGTGPSPTEVRAALTRFVDAYLDFCVDNPHIPALWMRRWLAEGTDVAELESGYAGPLVEEVSTVVRAVLDRAGMAADLDVDMLVFTIVWTSHSFVRAGVIDHSGRRMAPDDRVLLARFRRHLHDLVDRLVDRP